MLARISDPTWAAVLVWVVAPVWTVADGVDDVGFAFFVSSIASIFWTFDSLMTRWHFS